MGSFAKCCAHNHSRVRRTPWLSGLFRAHKRLVGQESRINLETCQITVDDGHIKGSFVGVRAAGRSINLAETVRKGGDVDAQRVWMMGARELVVPAERRPQRRGLVKGRMRRRAEVWEDGRASAQQAKWLGFFRKKLGCERAWPGGKMQR